MRCCASCFGDPHLRREIIPARIETSGTCSYCAAANQILVSPSRLRDEFEILISIYVRDPAGTPLLELLQEDWAIFGPVVISTNRAAQLLGDILDDHEIAQVRFAPSEMCRSDSLERWNEFRRELMHVNRFFPKTAPNLDRLRSWLEPLSTNSSALPVGWYRARLQNTDNMFAPCEMGAPPPERASHGRANPAGIPYLYLSSNIVTAISELRPHTGEIATVASFTIGDSLKFVDLRSPRDLVSPFVLEDERVIGLLRGDIGFLVKLGEELTRPVLPHAAAIDYIPSQYLCEFVKDSGYDGVVYRSSVGDGFNIALFDPAKATIGEVSQRRVSRVSVQVG